MKTIGQMTCYWRSISLGTSRESEAFRSIHPEIPFDIRCVYCPAINVISCPYFELRQMDLLNPIKKEIRVPMDEEALDIEIGRLNSLELEGGGWE